MLAVGSKVYLSECIVSSNSPRLSCFLSNDSQFAVSIFMGLNCNLF